MILLAHSMEFPEFGANVIQCRVSGKQLAFEVGG